MVNETVVQHYVQPRRSTMTQVPDLLVRMMEVSDDSVQCVRKTAELPPRVSVYDVLGSVTGYAPEDRSKLFKRLSDQFPEVRTLCTNFKFSGRGQRDTLVTNAEGIVTIIMLLPGRAAAMARQSAASVLVRYLGGDLSLVQEVMHNHNLQAELEPEHPAAIFGQSVQPPGPTPYEIEMARNARMQALHAAYQLAQAIDSTSQPRLRVEAQRAIDDVLLPHGETTDQYVDAAAILRERAFTEDQIARLAPEFGKDLKLVCVAEGREAQGNEQRFGQDRHQVGLYHRTRDASLIEDVMASFRQRPLFARAIAGQPDLIASRRQALLNVHGRGRRRSQRGHQ